MIFGPGCLQRLPELVRELGGTHVLLVTDPGLAKAGHPQRALQYLREADIAVAFFDQVRENPTASQVENGVEFAREHQIDLILAVGGGSSMDCAKGINFLLSNGGKMEDYKGFGKAHKPMYPSIGVPTTTGTGSEAQCYALITDESTHLKMACGDKKAAFRIAILDPEVTVSQPRTITAITGIDAVAHALESMVCKRATPISQVFSQASWHQLNTHFETCLSNPNNLQARAGMQLGAHYAGVAIEHAMLGITHSCANPLTAHYGIVHGIAIGILLPHVLRFNGETHGHLYTPLVQNFDRAYPSPAHQLADRVEELVHCMELPFRLRDCGVSETILPVLAEEANEQWTARFNPRDVNETDLLSLYQKAW